MDDLIELIAKALYEENHATPNYSSWEGLTPSERGCYLDCARAALAAISSSTTHRVVPVEPTDEMRDAGEAAGWPEGGKSSIEMQWAAMLSASPKVTSNE